MSLNLTKTAGFTLVELISVIVIMGVLAAIALPRFADVDVFASRGYFENAVAATRYAQQLATSSGCSIQLEFDAASDLLTISRWTGGADCTERTPPLVTVAKPGGGGAFSETAPNNVDVQNDLLIYFDRVGRPRNNAGSIISDPLNLRVTIDGRRLQITPETGLVVEN